MNEMRRRYSMKIISFYATKTFKLVLEFENGKYRVCDFIKSVKSSKDLLKELTVDVDLFLSIKIDNTSGDLYWDKNRKFSAETLYELSMDLDQLINPPPRKIRLPVASKTTHLTEASKSRTTRELEKSNKELLERIRINKT
ncbi:hypothetical protein [Psychrobacillus sp. FSL K6-1267]|uniref:hypothetical protein n=1 Tax=Psychrobacillus sp. FSL K6-1267 TaxID=2921543 RepID=UPI0030FA3DFB